MKRISKIGKLKKGDVFRVGEDYPQYICLTSFIDFCWVRSLKFGSVFKTTGADITVLVEKPIKVESLKC